MWLLRNLQFKTKTAASEEGKGVKWQEEILAGGVKGGCEAEGRKWQEESEQGTSLTYMRWEGLQGGKSLLWERAFRFRVIGLEAWARLIHWHGPTGPRRLSPLQGRGAGGVGVVWGAGGVVSIGWGLPPERGVLALQRLKLEETVGNTRRALSKSKLGLPVLSYIKTSDCCSRLGMLNPWSGEGGDLQAWIYKKNWVLKGLFSVVYYRPALINALLPNKSEDI